MNNLLICHTPLQCLLAQHIIKRFPEQHFELMMFGFADTAKIRRYFTDTAQYCTHSELILLNNTQSFTYFRQLYRLAHQQKKYHTIFAASIDNVVVHALLSGMRCQHFYTFDDGTANIIKGSVLREPKKYPFKTKILRQLCGIRTDLETLRKQSEGHYTLYPECENITQPLIPLKLFEQNNETAQTDSEICILLGQPFLPDATANAAFFQKLVQQRHCDFYCPHPRETYHINNVAYLQTDLIIEDYVLQQRQRNPQQAIRICTLFSTATLNLHGMPNVHIDVLRPNLPFFRQPHIAELYHLMQQKGIAIQDIE